MKIWLGTESEHELLPLHTLGDCSLMSESTQYSPEDLAQKVSRSVTIRVDTWEQTWQQNRNLIDQIRTALRSTPLIVKIQEDDRVLVDQTPVPGEIIYDRPMEPTADDLPENPNAWGTYQQQINISLKFDDHALVTDETPHLQAVFAKTGSTGSISLGNVFNFKRAYRARRVHEMRKIRDQAGGVVTMTGEIRVPNTAASITERRAHLTEQLNLLYSQLNGADGTLTYGPESNRVFERLVKVDDLQADINQQVDGIPYSITVSYTEFPDEDGYAVVDFTSSVEDDSENGDTVMTLDGKIGAEDKPAAMAKLAAIKTTVQTSNGFTAGQILKHQVRDRNAETPDGAAFLELSFSITYRKRASSIETFTLTISDSDDAKSGLITRTFTGSVAAAGATADAAYTAAVGKCRELGENKHPMRLSGRVTRQDRQTNATGTRECVRVEFAYEYLVKGTRVYLEVRSVTESETFGEDSEKIAGFIVAKDEATALKSYRDLVRNAFNSRIVRNESLVSDKMIIERGQYSAAFISSKSFVTMWTKLEFSFSAFKPKANGTFSFRYKFKVSKDFTSLRRAISISGEMYGTAALLNAAAAGTSGNVLDAYLSGLIPAGSVHLISDRETNHEQIGNDSNLKNTTTLAFNESFEARMTGDSTILECEFSERIQYSGTRWVEGQLPDGPSIVQNCGTASGSRTISGFVKAGTETAAMAWIKQVRALTFPTGNGGGAAPTTRYQQPPEIDRSWEFLPLTDGKGRGESANFACVKASFTFSEILTNFPYVEI